MDWVSGPDRRSKHSTFDGRLSSLESKGKPHSTEAKALPNRK
jgi:hypothetical protein